TPGFAVGDTLWQIGKHVSIAAQLVTDRFRSRLRVVNRKDPAASPFGELVNYLARFWHIATYCAARAILRLHAIDNNVERLQGAQGLFEFEFAAAIQAVANYHHRAFLR